MTRLRHVEFMIASAMFLSGCATSSVTYVKLDCRKDYSSPEQVPYANTSERRQYLKGFRAGWLNVAQSSLIKYQGDTYLGGVVGKKILTIEWLDWRAPYPRGYEDGEAKAEVQFRELNAGLANAYRELMDKRMGAEHPPPN